ncbi:MAG: 1-(5-phosphoribosyl)-5-[(5-phosphoribosylamino)methylideneamino]imidazole-4-carboxamide isomerase [Gammaproteobacteria bacterium]|jgi:phosphoribosylformimino-5-aminoimidazole carboxamide ribotide isomerase|nr:1-(5-phosphoribosyl)-5-[(5-phosphoribosylamino)methylideneamino]imidazole-4-carboxamide isomerase [Gammaproteobacteria bacterium]
MKVIPAVDLQGGKCVRLFKGDFAQATEYSDDPAAVARQFAELQTTDLHIVDLDGARSGTQENHEIITAIATESDMAIQVGGGIRDHGTIAKWLAAGVSRCVVGSLVVTEPDAVKSWLVRHGSEHIVLALDVEIGDGGMPMITTHGWTRPSSTSLFECIAEFRGAGLRHVLCTDVSRDGAMTGPNLDLYSDILRRFPELKLQASGGVRNLQDLQALRDRGVPAAITGRALLDGKITPDEVASFQQNA